MGNNTERKKSNNKHVQFKDEKGNGGEIEVNKENHIQESAQDNYDSNESEVKVIPKRKAVTQKK